VSDEEVLATVMRRMLADEDVYIDVEPGTPALCSDGWVKLEPGEAEVLYRIKQAARK